MRDECKLSLFFQWKGTVLTKIWWKIILMKIYTSLIVGLHFYIEPFKMNIPLTFLSVMGVVTGLLLGFRTNTAYDRYWEGRRLWTQLAQQTRTLTRCIWLGVKEPEPEVEEQDKVDKKLALKLLTAFAFATKNYLRGDYTKDSVKEIMGSFPDLSRQKPGNVKHQNGNEYVIIEGTNPNRDEVDEKTPVELGAYDFCPESNLPIEISCHLFKFIQNVNAQKLADGPTVSSMYSSVTSLIECLSGFERIQRTPMPKAYNVHLHQLVWVYLLALPYQYVESLGWLTVGAVGFASFAFLGILALGWEIEKPFGTDHNDLPLNDFCVVIQHEIQLMTQIPFNTQKGLETTDKTEIRNDEKRVSNLSVGMDICGLSER